MTTSLPSEMQYVWATASILAFLGGIVWIAFIFWPYLKWSKAMMIKTYELSVGSAAALADLQAKLAPVLDKLEKTVAKASEIVEGPEVRNAVALLGDIYRKGDLERILKTLHDKILPAESGERFASKEEAMKALKGEPQIQIGEMPPGAPPNQDTKP